MKNKTLWWVVRVIAGVVLAVGTGALAQAPTPTHFSGLINDYYARDHRRAPRLVHGKCTGHGRWI